MVNVDVVFFAHLRELAGMSEKTVALKDGARVDDLIEALSLEYGLPMRREIVENEGMRVFISGREYWLEDGRKEPLSAGDKVVFLYPFVGG
jgi:molybdopterin converting factor small subunit